MKKSIFTIIIFAITVASCDPAKWMDKYYSQMCIKNDTSEIIKISGTGDRYMLIGDATVFPGDSVSIWAIDKFRYLKELPAFDDFVEADNIHVDVYTEDDVLILSWDNGTEAGRQSDFFKEASWRATCREDGISFFWTYDIGPEDIDTGIRE